MLMLTFFLRLVYRKGADLLAQLIPEVCARHPDVTFLICGDGNKRVLIEVRA
jgi:phosphatidylinositol glycan class A protein